MPSTAPYFSHATRNSVRGVLFSKLAGGPGSGGGNPPDGGDGDPGDGGHKPRRTRHLIFRMAIHEASHAVIRLYLGLGTITKITIDAPNGGYIAWRTDELHEQTEEFFTAVLAATWAGRAGEEVIMDSVAASGGGDSPDSDQEVATKIAYDMETTMGFGQTRPLLYRGSPDWRSHLVNDPELSAHVNARLEAAYDAARKMVAKQRETIMQLAEALLVRGTLEGAELESQLKAARKLLVK